ncbi:MAG: hypothetical protein PHD02_04670 [Bacilli bacterium]|nr:hypothetical protein [Bacilli bacterium]
MLKEEIIEDLVINEEIVNSFKNNVDLSLKNYIETNIIAEYDLNDKGHDINHINYVLNRAIEIAQNIDLNCDILYVCVMFHDIACHIDRDNHEILSAKRAYEDKFLLKIFNSEQMEEIKSAIEDHRASLEYIPRNIYGKVLSSADRKVEVKLYLWASISYDIKKHPELSKEETITNSYDFAIKKFGKEGYAVSKFYVEDEKYERFLSLLQQLIEDKTLYFEIAGIIYEQIKNN